MKKLIYLLFAVTLLMLTVCVASADVLNDPNGDRYIIVTYPDGAQSEKLYLRKDLIGTYEVYGQPEQVIGATPPQLYDDAQGQWRYLGYSRDKMPFSNPVFRKDPGSFPVTEREYIARPQNIYDSGCANITQYITDEDWPSIYSQIQQYAISQGYPADAFWNDMSYYGVITSSLNGNQGALKVLFYRQGDSPSNWRYETIPNLIVKIPDYYTQFSWNVPQRFTPGETINFTLNAGQLVNYDFSFLKANISVYMVADSLITILSEDRNFSSGTDTINFSVTMPNAGSVTLIAVINRNGLNGNYAIDERNYGNNVSQIVLENSQEISAPAPPPLPEPVLSGNLSADSIELLNENMTPHSGNTEVNKPYKVRARFSSTFNEAGWVKLRLCVWKEAGWMDEKQAEYVYMQPYSTIEKVWDYRGGAEKNVLYATVNYKYTSSWIGEPYNGVMEKNYLDNEKHIDVTGIIGDVVPPTSSGWKYSLYYHPMRYHEVPIIEKESVIGWKKVKYIKDDTEYEVRVHLIE